MPQPAETVSSVGFGCAFIVDDAAPGGAAGRPCDAPCRPGSAYCPEHDALCHLPAGSAAERRQLRAIEALARVVGGRRGRDARSPPAALLRRLERTERAFSRHECSLIVHGGHGMATRQTGTTATGAREAAEAGPTPERRRHDPVERVERAIPDAAGYPARPYRSLDTLVVMERRGSITTGMRQAGEDFRARFAVAQLDPLRAVDLRRLRFDGDSRPEREAPGLRIELARRAVWVAIQAVGGIASPAGSCLWHVLGWQRTLKEWAVEQGWAGRRVSQEAASGILVAALGALEAHFRAPINLSKSHLYVDKSGSI